MSQTTPTLTVDTRSETWKNQCLVRWLIKYRIKDKAAAHLWLEGFKKLHPKSTLERDVKYQWSKGNRGEEGDWR